MDAVAELSGQRVELVDLAAREGDVGAGLVEGARDAGADAAGRAGDEGVLAGEIEHGFFAPSFRERPAPEVSPLSVPAARAPLGACDQHR